jgi:parvulin-like peptidyl-prolyl isomerase
VITRIRRCIPFVLAGAVVLLAACGSRFQSPAATVDGRDISQDALKTEVDLALADPQLAQQISGPEGDTAKADLARQALATLIRRELAQEYAETRRIVVTPGDIDSALDAVIAQLGGQAQFDDLVKARGLTMPRVRQLLGEQVLLEKIRDDVVARLPGPPPASTDDRDLAFQNWLSDRVANAEVTVNPRFGRFDHRTGEVLPITSTADLG